MEISQSLVVETPAEGSDKVTDKADTLLAGEDHTLSNRRKPISFYFAFSCLLIMVLLVSIDSTCMAVSISVSPVMNTRELCHEAVLTEPS